MKTQTIRFRSIMLVCTLGIIFLANDLWAHRTQGPLGGFRDQYSGTPVIEQTAQSDIYNIYFCAFDMGHEVHMIAYARLRRNDDLYQDMIRVSVHDPDGNNLVVYRDHVAEVLDEPIQWAYPRVGQYDVTVELQPVNNSRVLPPVSFTMSLNRESPTSIILVSAFSIIAVTLIAVGILKRKRQSAKS